MFRQLSMGLLNAAVSPLAEEELGQTAEPVRSRLLALLDQLDVLDADEAEVTRLAELYVRDGVIPPVEVLDARHAAFATVGRADVIVSLNLRHLANEWAERRLNAVNLREGYQFVNIRTPEQVVLYED